MSAGSLQALYLPDKENPRFMRLMFTEFVKDHKENIHALANFYGCSVEYAQECVELGRPYGLMPTDRYSIQTPAYEKPKNEVHKVMGALVKKMMGAKSLRAISSETKISKSQLHRMSLGDVNIGVYELCRILLASDEENLLITKDMAKQYLKDLGWNI